MTVRGPVTAGLALVALIALTGCEPTGDLAAPATASAPASAPDSPDPDSAAALIAAAARLGADTVRVRTSIQGEMSLTGVIDPKGQNAELKMDMGAVDDGTQADIRKIGDDVWVRLRGPVGKLAGTNRRWLYLNASQMTPASSLAVIPGDDPAGALAMARAVTGVRRVGADGFAGTIDLTRTPKYSAATLQALGVRATAVPFSAQVDADGRLVRLTLYMSAVTSGAGRSTTWFTDFGVDVDVTRPPADETAELPAELRSIINA